MDSIVSVDRAWARWCVEHGLDPDEVLPKIHGRRAPESIADVGPHLDQAAALTRLTQIEAEETYDLSPVPGAIEFLSQIGQARWGLVTSGVRILAEARAAAGGIRIPDARVFGEDVALGKPAPDPYLEGARRLGLPPQDIVVFEDVAAGIASARAAGCMAIGIGSTPIPGAHATVSDYRQVVLSTKGDFFTLQVSPISESSSPR